MNENLDPKKQINKQKKEEKKKKEKQELREGKGGGVTSRIMFTKGKDSQLWMYWLS